MSPFKFDESLRYNNELIKHPVEYFRKSGCQSWLYLVGEEFSSMEGGMSFDQVRQATPDCINVISDPPRNLTIDLAKQHISALDKLPRPTLISCRTGPRASAVAYLYAGLSQGANADEVLSEAEKDGAPFTKMEELKTWVRSTMNILGADKLYHEKG